MDSMYALFAIVLALINLAVTVRLWRKTEFDRFQKAIQTGVIWAVPLIGALVIWTFINDDETPKGPRNPNDGQGVDGMPGGIQ